MDHEPLVKEQIDAGARFLREFDKYAPVRVAFWLRESEGRYWHLYVASDEITDDNFDLAYGEVIRIAAEFRNPWFDPLRVKVLSADDPLAKAALEVQQRFPGWAPPRVSDTMFGGVFVDEVYIYPSPLPASPP